jgi:hypothetical protein
VCEQKENGPSEDEKKKRKKELLVATAIVLFGIDSLHTGHVLTQTDTDCPWHNPGCQAVTLQSYHSSL